MFDWSLSASESSKQTINPVREIESSIKLPTDFYMPTYSLALGDPSVFPDFAVPPVMVEAVSECLLAGKGNGYTDSSGAREARETIAHEFSYENIQLKYTDVIMDVGCTGAINTTLHAFLDPGDNILMPSPGYPMYKAMALNMLAEAVLYDLKPHQQWEVDIEDLERKANSRTKLLVVINPSNPCGSVYSKEHLLELLTWAERKKICILADECFHNMTYGRPFFPMGSLTDHVPVFTVGSMSKMFLVPGWRTGWLIIYDKYNYCAEIREGIFKVKNMLQHTAPFILQAIPKIFNELPHDYFPTVMRKVKERAEVVLSRTKSIPCLSMEMPQGSIYCMISIDFTTLDFKNAVVFAQLLAEEQGVQILPAEAFFARDAFRLVLIQPLYVIEECMERIETFLSNHTLAN
jgi:tyrosine aminotransferase